MALIHKIKTAGALLVSIGLLSACGPAALRVPGPKVGAAIPGVAQDNASGVSEVGGAPADRSADSAPRAQVEKLDPPPMFPIEPVSRKYGNSLPEDNALTVSASQLPTRDFIAYIFGELLKVNFVIAEGAPGLEQPLTLDVQRPVSSKKLFRLVEELLAPRGLLVVEKEGVFFVGPVSGRSETGIPIGFGSRPEDVPDVPGSILQIVPLRYALNITIENTVGQYIDVEIRPNFQQGSYFIKGTRNAILRAIEVIKMFDQPNLRASRVGLVNLTFISSKEFTEQLTVLLDNEGISAGVGSAAGKSVALVPLDQLGAVAVFASTSNLLDRVEFWARQIDRPSQGTSERYFIYQPKFARASDLFASLGPLLGAATAPPNTAGNLARDTRSALGGDTGAAPAAPITQANALRRESAGSAAAAPAAASFRGEGVTVSVDSRSNALIFFTTGLRFESLLPMIKRLDVPPKQILLEATVAEVSLTGDFARGVEFAFTRTENFDPENPSLGERREYNGGTLGRLGMPSGGFALNYIPNLTDQIRLRLSATDGRVNVLSNPVIVVRDGVTASISVGNDVPTVGATASDPLQSDKQITTVLYRKTGLDLAITPTINAQGLVVMQINQKISSTVPGSSGVQGAPIFFERSVATEVVAGSGQSVLLAGLISESGSETSSNVPFLSKLPGLGWLFSSDAKKSEKTELVLLITPRILETPEQWDAVRSSLSKGLRYLDLGNFVKPVEGESKP